MFNSSSKLQRWANGKMQKKWKLFHATDFESLMYPSITYCYMLGIFPYKINAMVFEISTPRYILSTIIICVSVIFLLYVLYLINFSMKILYTDTLNIPTNLNRNSFYILNGFIAVVTYILSGPRMHLLQTIKDISSKLPSELYQKLSKLIHAKDLLGSLFLLLEGLIYCKMNMHFIIKIYIIYITLLTFHMDMLYMNCVCILKACFKRINDNLENMRKYTMIYHLDKMCYKQRNPLLLIELRALKKQHLMISNTVQMLNIIFSLQLLATVILTFVRITFNLYCQILYLQRGIFLINIEDHIYNTFVIMILMYYFIKILLIIWACETGKNQTLQIGTIVHDVLNSIDDNEIKNELQLFSLQILHRDNTFSAKSLIMDATLLTAIVGSVSTYLLILIQVLKMKYYCDDEIARNVTQIIH